MNRLLFLLTLSFFALVSCSKEEETPAPPPTPTYTLSFSAEEGGTVSTEGGTYNQGSKITVTATPDGQYLFKEWSDGSTVNPREITVNADLTLKATFVKKTYPLSVSIDGEGTVQEEVIIQGSTTETQYNAGTTVRLTATANEGWEFSLWVVDGEVIAENPIEVAIEKGREATVFFKRTQFELNITIEGEGTVKEEVIVQPSQYDFETVVRLTAVPADGYVFSGWSGDVASEENPIEVEVKDEINFTAKFNQSAIIVLKTQVEIEYDPSVSMLSALAGHGYGAVASTIHYSNELNHFIFSAGQATSLDSNPYNALEVHPSPSATFILGENGWELHKLDYEVSTWGIRNYDRKENFLVIGDGNEIGNAENWKGDIYLGEINEDMTWTKVTKNQEDMGFFHGISIGDIDSDGLMDIAALPDWHFFKNKGGNSFEKLNVNYTETNEIPDIYHMYPVFQGGGPTEQSPFYCGAGFEIHIVDLNGDGINEIIQANYGKGESWRDDQWKSICGMDYRVEVFKLNGEKFDVAWRSKSDEDFFPKDIGGATRIRSFDMDNDGKKDIIITREGEIGHTIEVWKGLGNLEFEPLSLYNSKDYQFIFREFEVMDVNKDGYLDVVLYSNGWGNVNGVNSLLSGYFLNPNNEKEGIKLNNFILINDGNGNIRPYSGKDLVLKGVYPEKLTPFMKGERLHFFGSYIGSRDYSEFITNFYNQERNSVKPILWDISVEID